MLRRRRLRLDGLCREIGREDADAGVDVIEIADQLPELDLTVFDLASEFGALADEGGYDVGVFRFGRHPDIVAKSSS